MQPCIGQGNSFDLTNAEVVHSNLGGLGPDLWAPPQLRYTNVGSAFFGNGSTIYFDLLVTNRSAYSADDPSLNGMYGELAQVNVGCGVSVTLRVQTVRSCASGVSCAVCDKISGSTARAACYAAGCFCFGSLVTDETSCSGVVKELERLLSKLLREGAARKEEGVQPLMNVLLARPVEYQRKPQSVRA